MVPGLTERERLATQARIDGWLSPAWRAAPAPPPRRRPRPPFLPALTSWFRRPADAPVLPLPAPALEPGA